MVEFIQNLIGNDIISTIIMSAIPLIELKGGIVFARGTGMSFFFALLYAFIGSTAIFIVVYFLLKPILNLMKKIKWFNKLALKVESYFSEKAENAVKKQKEGIAGDKIKSETRIKQLGVFIFVAIPLPLTGVWAGTAISVFLNMKFKDAILPVFTGNLVAGLIISILAEVCLQIWTIKVLDYILYGLFALAIILLGITIIKMAKSKPKTQNDGETSDKKEE